MFSQGCYFCFSLMVGVMAIILWWGCAGLLSEGVLGAGDSTVASSLLVLLPKDEEVEGIVALMARILLAANRFSWILVCLCFSSMCFLRFAHRGTGQLLDLHVFACWRQRERNCLHTPHCLHPLTWDMILFILTQVGLLQFLSLHWAACTRTWMKRWMAQLCASLGSFGPVISSGISRPTPKRVTMCSCPFFS